MLAVVCSMLANTSADSEGKQFVYRKGGTSGQTSGIPVLPDPTMMRPEDFLPVFGGQVAEVDDHPMLRHRRPNADPAEPLLALLKERMGAIDLRKPVRSAPRPT